MRIAPSILAADFGNLQHELAAISTADEVHVDVMDGHFVPNLSFGPPVIAAIRPYSSLPFDVHLMVSNAESVFESYIRAGASRLTFHVEAVTHLDRLIQACRDAGVGVGVSLNPATSLDALTYIVDRIDLVLLMSVNPGFGGQKFIPYTLRKIAELQRMVSTLENPPLISVDGGVDLTTIGDIAAAGATMVVAGSAVYGHPDGPATAIAALRDTCGH